MTIGHTKVGARVPNMCGVLVDTQLSTIVPGEAGVISGQFAAFEACREDLQEKRLM